MATSARSGEHWQARLVDDVLVYEFQAGMDTDEFGGDAYDAYTDFLAREDVTAMVTVVNMDDPFGPDAFETWERSASVAVDHGIERWAVVAEGIKQLSLKSKLDVAGLAVFTTDSRDEALDWAGE
jgi:hypothetical protein